MVDRSRYFLTKERGCEKYTQLSFRLITGMSTHRVLYSIAKDRMMMMIIMNIRVRAIFAREKLAAIPEHCSCSLIISCLFAIFFLLNQPKKFIRLGDLLE